METKDYMASTTNFKAHGLDTFELSVDSVNLPGFPLKAQGNTVMDFYHKFLKVTNFFDNPYSNGPMSYKDFSNGNFLIVENLIEASSPNYQHYDHMLYQVGLNIVSLSLEYTQSCLNLK